MSLTTRWIKVITVILATAAILNVWAVSLYFDAVKQQRIQDERITKLEKQICTKAEMQVMINVAFEAHFDKFELHLQDKYRITPKGK